MRCRCTKLSRCFAWLQASADRDVGLPNGLGCLKKSLSRARNFHIDACVRRCSVKTWSVVDSKSQHFQIAYERGGFAHHPLKSPVCSCVSITLPAFIVNANHS